MKSDHILYSAIGGSLVGLAWAGSAFSVLLSFERLVAYGAVAGLIALAALDYGFRAKKLFRW